MGEHRQVRVMALTSLLVNPQAFILGRKCRHRLSSCLPVLSSDAWKRLQRLRLHSRSVVNWRTFICWKIDWHRTACGLKYTNRLHDVASVRKSQSPDRSLLCIRASSHENFAIYVWSPNINGYFRIDYATFIHSTGAFSVNKTNEEVLAQGAQLLNVNRGMNFFAYQSSSVYSGSKLQPESLQVLACIRFWYRLGSVKPDFVL